MWVRGQEIIVWQTLQSISHSFLYKVLSNTIYDRQAGAERIFGKTDTQLALAFDYVKLKEWSSSMSLLRQENIFLSKDVFLLTSWRFFLLLDHYFKRQHSLLLCLLPGWWYPDICKYWSFLLGSFLIFSVT